MIVFDDLRFPERVYLSGEDCFFMMLESNLNRHGTGNNILRIVLHYDECIAAETLLKQLNNSPIVHWMCNIQLINGGLFQRPYWQYRNSRNTITIREHQIPRDAGVPHEVLNSSISIGENSYIACDFIRHNEGSCVLILSWHHILMDGRGAGMFLRHLSGQEPLNEHSLTSFFPKKSQRLSFYNYIRNMYEVKAFIQQSSKGKIASFFSANIHNREGSFSWYSRIFTVEETCKIDGNAKQNGASLGATNFLIAASSTAVYRYLQKRGIQGAIWIPVPYDGRKRGGFGPVITNQISFLFYRLEHDDFQTMKTTVQCINKQFTDQLKIGMPKKYNHFLDMMRHIPLRLYRFLATKESKGAVSSFLFSSAGENNWDMKNLMDQPFRNIDIIPPYTFPPGITVSFFRFEGKLKMNLVVSDLLFSRDESHQLLEEIATIISSTKS